MRILLYAVLLLNIGTLTAQVPQKVAAELFTNTLCSICGTLDPNINNIINTSDEVVKISYYPSSPYQNCFFSKQNKTENDDRTKFYNAFGGTPRIYLQGLAQSSQLNIAALNNFLGKSTDFEIKIDNVALSNSTAEVTYTIFRRGNDTTQSASLFLAVQEDSIEYNAPNGIKLHYGVFRKALSALNGDVINLPIAVDDSIVIVKTYTTLLDWDRSLLSAYAILQHTSDKKVIQVEKQKLELGTTSIANLAAQKIIVYPNPALTDLTISGAEFETYRIIDLSGRVLMDNSLTNQTIEINHLSVGNYFLVLQARNGQSQVKLFSKID